MPRFKAHARFRTVAIEAKDHAEAKKAASLYLRTAGESDRGLEVKEDAPFIEVDRTGAVRVLSPNGGRKTVGRL